MCKRIQRTNHLIGLLVMTALAAALGARAEVVLRVYHIGNSVTDTINYRALGKLAQSRGHQYVFGRHMIPGATLSWIGDHADSGFAEKPYGHYTNALPDFEWDVLTLQPFDRHLDDEKEADLVLARKFIDLALPKSPNLRVYVYSRWPRKEKDGALDFDAKWARTYTGGWDNTEETRDYFEKLVQTLRKAYPARKERILMVPVGDVLFELNQRMKSGRVPGYTNIAQVYKDGIHFNEVGSYIVGCTFYATLFKDDPKGLPASAYGVSDVKLAEIIQDAAWKVVRSHPLAGIAPSSSSPRVGVPE